MERRNYLIALAIIYEGNWRKIMQAINAHEEVSEETQNSYLKHLKANVLTILDPEYPEYLKHSFCPPFVLFYYGDISLISDVSKNIAVVGGRKPSREGLNNIDFIVSGVAKRFNIVSGLAQGVDAAAHRAALYMGGKTIAVLGNGIEYCYPSINSELYETIKKDHLVISEYYNYLSPLPEHFHQRNRLIVAFSRAIILGEAHLKSGTSITANYALMQNKDLMTIPSSDIHDSLNNLFIRDGCPVVLDHQDVFDNLSNLENSLLCEVK